MSCAVLSERSTPETASAVGERLNPTVLTPAGLAAAVASATAAGAAVGGGGPSPSPQVGGGRRFLSMEAIVYR